ncbi:MAG: hypothetical protein IKL73_04335 [Lachnospiraceae bacterium]|nr:hypothetical protein [Lachnospiraceae bacterium]
MNQYINISIYLLPGVAVVIEVGSFYDAGSVLVCVSDLIHECGIISIKEGEKI